MTYHFDLLSQKSDILSLFLLAEMEWDFIIISPIVSKFTVSWTNHLSLNPFY